MKTWLGRLLAEPTCPGCGRMYERWTDTLIWRGYRVERRWHGCPAYREASTRKPIDLDEKHRHAAGYDVGKRTPLVSEEAER